MLKKDLGGSISVPQLVLLGKGGGGVDEFIKVAELDKVCTRGTNLTDC